jgi:hypothetical protein
MRRWAGGSVLAKFRELSLYLLYRETLVARSGKTIADFIGGDQMPVKAYKFFINVSERLCLRYWGPVIYLSQQRLWPSSPVQHLALLTGRSRKS